MRRFHDTMSLAEINKTIICVCLCRQSSSQYSSGAGAMDLPLPLPSSEPSAADAAKFERIRQLVQNKKASSSTS
jgi:hypothetical protein